MGVPRWLVISIAITTPTLLAASVVLAVERQPLVERDVLLTPEHIERVKRILDAHNMRRRPGSLATIRVGSEDVETAANYAASHFAHGSARVKLSDGGAAITVSLPLRSGPIEGFLNVQAALVQTAALPRLESVRVGDLPIPDWLANAIVVRLIEWARHRAEYRAGVEALQAVRFSARALSVVYLWDKDLPGRIGKSVASTEEFEHLRPYQERLSEIATSTSVSLAQLLPPLFDLAAQRSAAGEDVIEQTRAAILVAALHAVGQPLSQIAPAAATWRSPQPQEVTLAGRKDTAKHFAVSAALAAYADTKLADAIGLYKEMEDARGGSGFSFNDLAADRAGTRFGERAVDTRAALGLQRRVAAGIEEHDVLPPIGDLPENMQEETFRRRFDGVGGKAYRDMTAEIERRLDTLPLLR